MTERTAIALITARGGSKRVPRKNVRLLGGKPLITYSIEHALRSRLIARTIVSTDDDEIAEIAQRSGAEIAERPHNLATDSATTVDVVSHVIEWLRSQSSAAVREIALLQPTTPFRQADLTDRAISMLRAGDCDSVTSHYRMDYPHPNRAKSLSPDGFVSPYCEAEIYNVARSALRPAFYRDGAIYAFNVDVPIRYGHLMGERQKAIIVPGERTINIDTEQDWLLAEATLKMAAANN